MTVQYHVFLNFIHFAALDGENRTFLAIHYALLACQIDFAEGHGYTVGAHCLRGSGQNRPVGNTHFEPLHVGRILEGAFVVHIVTEPGFPVIKNFHAFFIEFARQIAADFTGKHFVGMGMIPGTGMADQTC